MYLFSLLDRDSSEVAIQISLSLGACLYSFLVFVSNARFCLGLLSFCALILFEPFLLLFGILGSTCAKWYFVPTPKWSMVAARWQRDGSGKCGGSAAAVAWLGQQWCWQQLRWWRKRQRHRVGN
jgi:hypothetical protein